MLLLGIYTFSQREFEIKKCIYAGVLIKPKRQQDQTTSLWRDDRAQKKCRLPLGGEQNSLNSEPEDVNNTKTLAHILARRSKDNTGKKRRLDVRQGTKNKVGFLNNTGWSSFFPLHCCCCWCLLAASIYNSLNFFLFTFFRLMPALL